MGRIDSKLVASGASSSAITGSGTSGQIAYFDGTQTITSSSKLLYSNTNGRISIVNTGATQAAQIGLSVESTGAATVSGYQVQTISFANGYGSGIAFASPTSVGGTVVNMAKVVADGDSAWNTTASTQDARITFWSATDGSLVERFRLSSSGAHVITGVALNCSNGAAGTFTINNNAGDGAMIYSGGNSGTTGGNIVCYGTDHASKPNRVEIRGETSIGILVHTNANQISLEYNTAVAGTMQLFGSQFSVFNNPLVTQAAAIADPTGGATVDAECRAALIELLDAERAYGWIDT